VIAELDFLKRKPANDELTLEASLNLLADIQKSSNLREKEPERYRSYLADVVKRLRTLTLQPSESVKEDNPNVDQSINGRPHRLHDDMFPVLEIKFQSVLKYVDLPSFSRIEDWRGDEPRLFLQWLSEYHHVKKVFEVKLDDFPANALGEEAIAMAIKPLKIETLNWRRLDLSVPTILDAAPGVSQLYLYSSGNRGILDHWCGDGGVCQLTNVC